jgi:probable HAF family extracellular repeat protein
MVKPLRTAPSCLVAVVALCGSSSVQAQPVYSFASIDPPGATATFAQGLTNSGQVVGNYNDAANVSHGFLRTSAGTFTSFDFPGARQSFASDINASGQIVGTYTDSANSTHSYLLSGGTFSTLSVPSSFSTSATGINAFGQVVGYYLDSAQNGHGFLLSGGVYTTIDGPGAASNFPAAINAAGQIVGNYIDASSASVGYVRNAAGTFTPIVFPGAAGETDPFGINALDSVVGFYDDGIEFVGFALRGGGYSNFPQAPGFTDTLPSKINDLDQIVGTYTSADGVIHGFLATPVPEPSSLALLGIGGLVAILRRRRRVV